VRRLVLPGIPFIVSLLLSVSTVGSHVGWQDSGFFLVAVKELGILYPPGFVLYVLLCKAWTLALWFVDFTYAVHLFSSVCAAAAAGTIAVAARDLLKTDGPIFRTVRMENGPASWVGASVGCLAAAGYTFWASAILAKVYAFYFLMLSLLLWRLIRADQKGRPRDFTIVAVLIGLSWQAHPSAALTGLALILFVWYHRKSVGGKGVAWRTALAALCAIGPIHLLPLFKRAGSVLQFGDPGTWSGFREYVTGSRFIGLPGVWGVDSTRVASVGRFFWEEFLGIGALLVVLGLYRLWKVNRKLLVGLAAWIVPVLVITVLFKLEGQHDFWVVAAWIPLWLVAAVGLTLIPQRAVVVGLAWAALTWAVVANRSDLDQRNYTVAETFGHAYLDQLEKGGVLHLASDDAQSIVLYLQRIQRVRPDVHVYGAVIPVSGATTSASTHYYERPEDPSEIWKSYHVRRFWTWGPFWLNAPLEDSALAWREPLAAEHVSRLFRRSRGQNVDRSKIFDTVVHPEPYEKRLLRLLLLARKNQADADAAKGNFMPAMQKYEFMLGLDPDLIQDPSVVLSLATTYVGLMRVQQAEATFKKALELDLLPAQRAQTYYFLAALCGDRPEAAEWKAKALASPDLAPPLREKLEGR
jgi:tetratricopeptide (TPR) repeat protein